MESRSFGRAWLSDWNEGLLVMGTQESPVLLQARIVAGAGGIFSVDIDDTPASLPEEEVFRFALHYYARVLFDLVRTQRSVRQLPQWIASIADVQLEAEPDLFLLAGVEGALVHKVPAPLIDTTVQMVASGVRNREVIGNLDAMRGTMLARSVLAVCAAVIPRLSPAMRSGIPAALANMNASYELSHQYADPASQHEVPVLAYLAAAFV